MDLQFACASSRKLLRLRKVLIKIGDLAKQSGKTVRALHYYEELGLLRPRQRTDGGFRLYAPEDARRIEMIAWLQDLGYPLERVAEIVTAWQSKQRGGEEERHLREMLQKGMEEAHKKIERMKALHREFEMALQFLDVSFPAIHE